MEMGVMRGSLEADCGRPQPNGEPVTEDLFQDLIAAGVARMIVLHGKSTVAGFMQRGSKTVEATVAGTSTPEAKPLFDLLGKDYTALQELFDRYGLVCSPKHIEPASFKALKVGLARALTGLLETRTDVVLNHMEILVLAELFRPVVPQMLSIIASADNIRVEGGR